MNVGERLTELRKKSGYTRQKLADELGIPYTTVRNYEKGDREPGHSFLVQIADKFGVTIDYLLGRDQVAKREARGDEPYAALINRYKALDVYGKEAVDSVLDIEYRRMQAAKVVLMPDAGKVIQLPEPWQASSAGVGQLVSDDIADMVTVQYNDYTGKADYIMRVCGDSMEPEIHDGERLLIRKQPAVEIGEVGIFLHEGERYVKRYQGDYLESINSAYADLAVNDTTECIGKVIGRLEPEWIQ